MNGTVDSLPTALNTVVTSSLLGFIHHARERHFTIGVRECLDSQRLAARVGITNKRMLQHGLKALLCQSPRDWERFDDLFDSYWRPEKQQQAIVSSIAGRAPRSPLLAQTDTSNGADFDAANPDVIDDSSGQAGAHKAGHAAASARESLANMPFNQLDNAAELRRMEDLCELLARRIRKRLLRRRQPGKRGCRVDMRRTFRNSLPYGGMPLSLAYRQRQRRTPKLVLLLDVSRSMSVYSYLFLRFARGILGAFRQADAFAFHTRLIHIGDTLREPSRRQLVEKMALISSGFGGGTRIDESLAVFNREYAHNLLGSRSTVVILSDGYDTGEPRALVEQLKRIKQRARRLLWLNPLLGQASYTPSTRSMQAALPLLDVFAPAHNLASLAALEQHLGR